MQPRIPFAEAAPEALKAMLGLERYVRTCGLEHSLLHLIKLRASLRNGCAYCVDMHTKDARAAGESEQRLYAVGVWREAPFFTERERAALAWTDALTYVHQEGVPDDLYRSVREHFSEKALVDLTMAVVAINGWNRIAISCGTQAGTYQPGAVAAVEAIPAAR